MIHSVDRAIEPGFTLELPVVAYTAGDLFYRIATDSNVDSMLLDAANRERYRNGQPYMSVVSEQQQQVHFGQAPLQEGQWFFLISNKGSKPARVQGQLEFRMGRPVPTGMGGIFRR